jgi:hypothetical protein
MLSMGCWIWRELSLCINKDSINNVRFTCMEGRVLISAMFQVFECWGFAVSKPPTGNRRVLGPALNDCLF